MKKKRSFIGILYVAFFILSCWNWFYTMLITSDIPVQVSRNEFIVAELNILIVFLLFIYLTKKGIAGLNIGLIIIPNFVWVINFLQDIKYNYHVYSTVLSSSMMVVLIIILVWNLIQLRKDFR